MLIDYFFFEDPHVGQRLIPIREDIKHYIHLKQKTKKKPVEIM